MNNKTKNIIKKVLVINVLIIMISAMTHRSYADKKDEVKRVEFSVVKKEEKKVEEVKPVVIVTPEVKPTETPKPAPKKVKKEVVKYESISKEEIKAYICEVFGPECANALIIAQHESGFNTNAISKTDDHGIFQLHCPLWCNYFKVTREQIRKDPKLNIRLAKVIYDRSNTKPSTDKKWRWRAWYTKKYL